jgi:hypothetical protein
MDSKSTRILNALCAAVVYNPALLHRWRTESIPWGDKLIMHALGNENELSEWLACTPQNWIFGLIRLIESKPPMGDTLIHDLLAFGTALAGLPVMSRESEGWRKTHTGVSPFVRIWVAQHSKLEPRIESLM